MSWLEGLRADPTKAAGGEATDEAVAQFAAEHTRNEEPWHLAEYIVPQVRNANGDGTRNPTRDALCEAARDARVGWCSWVTAVAEIETAARDSYAHRGSAFDEKDFARSVKYAVGEANAEDLTALEARYARTLAKERKRRDSWSRAERAMAPGGPWHPDTLWPHNKADDDAEQPAAVDGRYRLVSARELAEPVEPMRWLVRGVWPERSAGVLAGDKKSMKTWNLQALALAVAAGRPLFDKYHVVSPGPVLYLSGEGGRNTFANRHQVIAARYYIEPEMLRELPFGAEFGVGMLSDAKFIDAVKRYLDELQPKLVILDPLYAYHPSDVEVQNVYARGPMLADLRTLVGDEAALIVGDHFNKTAPGRLDLDNIAQAGMAQWADSWILQRHRETPNLDDNKYWLEVETGSRRGGGKHLEVDWTLERDKSDPDVIAWTSVDWDARPMTAKSGGKADSTVAAILQVVADHPFELTETQVLEKVGGKRDKTRDAFAGLKANGGVFVQKRERQEGDRTRTRDLVGPGENAERLREQRFRLNEPVPAEEPADSTRTPDGNG